MGRFISIGERFVLSLSWGRACWGELVVFLCGLTAVFFSWGFGCIIEFFCG